MALFVGGPADGWRLIVDDNLDKVQVALEPTEITSKTLNTFTYKRECISVGSEEYCIFIPNDWTVEQLVKALILYYREDNVKSRTNYQHCTGQSL